LQWRRGHERSVEKEGKWEWGGAGGEKEGGIMKSFGSPVEEDTACRGNTA